MKLVAYGGGVNSTAMLIGMVRREDIPFAILFADTGGEEPETYEFIGEFSEWLMARGFPAIETVTANRKDETLEAECLRKNTMPSLAYGFKKCSLAWKVEPQEKWARNNPACIAEWEAGRRIVKAIGYDADEPHRAKRSVPCERYEYWHPLIEWDWGRDECEEVCRGEGLYPSGSACFFCPASKKHEVIDLSKRHPDLYGRALAIESGASGTNQTVVGLGRHWRWRDVVNADASQFKLFCGEPELACGCYDG